jgi:hypothetical protein
MERYHFWENGSHCEDQAWLKGMAKSFYENLVFSESCDSLDVMLDAIPDMNEDLCKEYIEEEIHFALF